MQEVRHVAKQLRRIGTILLGLMLVAGLGAAPAEADTGGGCTSGYNNMVCISVWSGTTNPLRSDYYLYSFTRGEYKAEVWLLHKYGASNCNNVVPAPGIELAEVVPVTVGHSTVYTINKPPGSNCAKTQVIFYNNLGNWIYDNHSPWQRW